MTIKKQGAWGLWWLCGLTIGIYYLVWYQRINRELAATTGEPVPANGKWWSQIIPIFALIGLWQTANRLNAAHASVGSPTRVGPAMASIWSPWWFGSQTRYLQRRINILHDVLASLASRGFDSGQSVLEPPRGSQAEAAEISRPDAEQG